jgi:NAD(P)-dependent dehydrogenase (short-subunit alcohol dehydrogenase family)
MEGRRTETSRPRLVRISPAELRLFADASHDRSMLHQDCERARRGPYGGPIIFGGLGLLAAANALPRVTRTAILGIRAVFPQPMFVDVPYSVNVERRNETQTSVILADGGSTVLRATFSFGPGEGRASPRVREGAPRLESKRWGREALAETAAVTTTGSYGPAKRWTKRLSKRFDLAARGLVGYGLQAVLFASYFVGMEIPGESGVLSSLHMSLPQPEPARSSDSLVYEGSLIDIDPSLGSMTMAATLTHGGEAVGRLTCGAELQARSPGLDRVLLRRLLSDGQPLDGKVALVMGADGAIGSAVAEGLAMQGCSVYGITRNRRWRSSPESGVQMLVGECGSVSGCRRLREGCGAFAHGVDLLVCAAAPPIRSLRFHEDSAERYLEFIEESLRLIAVPIAAFLPLLSLRLGWCLVPSTAALYSMPPGWGHYLTAKVAVETMVASASRSWPDVEFVSARLPLVRTARLGSLAKEDESVPLERVSAWLVGNAESRRGPGSYCLDWEGEAATGVQGGGGGMR